MHAIEVQDLTKNYGDVEALRGVSFQVSEGEIFGLLGPNGAGKTSTVRILTTQSTADSGTATVAGIRVDEAPNEARAVCGVVAQGSGADLLATARENLTLQGRLFRLPRRDLTERVDELLRLFELEEAADRPVKTYSGGMKRRLDIALGLIHRPRVLFLDEPTTGLDPESRSVLWRELERQAKEEGLTILVTTHYLEEADQFANRLAILDRGCIVAQGTPNELKAEQRGDMISVLLKPDELSTNGTGPEKARGILGELAGVGEPLVDGGQIYVQAENGPRMVAMVVGALEGAGLPVDQVSLSRPSLEEVYLTLTGHAFAIGEPSETPA